MEKVFINSSGSKISILLILSLCIILFSCSGKSKVKPTETFDAEKVFASANEQLEKKNYDEARAIFLEVKNRDFSRKYAPLAQLKIADSYVKEDSPEMAISEYQKFIESYPDHQYASYAQYQIAMIYFNQIEGPERGYSGAAKALEEFEKLKKTYPRNPYKEEVELKIQKCRNIMADYEFLVGEFYFKKGSYNAAIGRFEGLLKSFPDYKDEAKVLFLIGSSYKKLKQKEKAKTFFSLLAEKYPNNKLAKDARKELSKLEK
ncbi:MAG: outer membrane protein assembly factor BamD [Nitrospirae bacterium]|jgi:outer membrane protein assembly factor BamD|nr:outer membrane protein assembly factor BamD [Nitrospirota bacterium]